MNHGSVLRLQNHLGGFTVQRNFPNSYPRIKDKSYRQAFPGKYMGLERVNVFSSPLLNGLQIKVLSIAFTAITQ